MSVEFQIADLEDETARRIIADWLGATRAVVLDTPLFSEDELEGLILAEGSTRGLLIFRDPRAGTTELRLSALSSRVEWSMAAELLTRFAGEGASITREGAPFTAKSPDDEAWQADWRHDFEASVRAITDAIERSDNKSASIPFSPRLAFPISGELVERLTGQDKDKDKAEPEDLEARFAAMVAPLITAYWGNTMILQGDIPMTAWGEIPTVAVGPRVIAPRFLLDQETNLVPIESLAELLGERLIELGESIWLLPELTAEDDALRDRIRAAAKSLEDIPPAPPSAADPTGFDPQDLPIAVRDFAALIVSDVDFQAAKALVAGRLGIPEQHMAIIVLLVGETYARYLDGETELATLAAGVVERTAEFGIPEPFVTNVVGSALEIFEQARDERGED